MSQSPKSIRQQNATQFILTSSTAKPIKRLTHIKIIDNPLALSTFIFILTIIWSDFDLVKAERNRGWLGSCVAGNESILIESTQIFRKFSSLLVGHLSVISLAHLRLQSSLLNILKSDDSKNRLNDRDASTAHRQQPSVIPFKLVISYSSRAQQVFSRYVKTKRNKILEYH